MTMKLIRGYSKYLVSNKGEVYSKHINSLLKPCFSGRGYPMVTLCENKVRKNVLVHRLVAEAFLKNKNNYLQINHIDGNKLNNKVSNLEWCTGSQNIKHAYSLGLKINKIGFGVLNPRSKLNNNQVIEIRNLLKTTNLYEREIALLFNVSRSTISSIKHNINWVV
jgi:hypothetical protein